jgi:hypothetical protein
MTSALKLTVTYFDSLENSVAQAEYIQDEQLFIDDSEKTSHAKCSEYISDMRVRVYLGWNQEVYPKIKVEQVFLK